MAGLGRLPVDTVFEGDKLTLPDGDARARWRLPVRGYEIRHGRLVPRAGFVPWLAVDGADGPVSAADGAGTVVGTTVHGLFEEDAFRSWFLG